ncbi:MULTISPECIES: LuxR C-terminal-related transcriptional regulator [Catenuloplanes]|uniref:DNA-binding CsgD family transcriptional regulator n=1 Tax=Catenuloplanes niger TaxID=587534 RepID=A0AAE4A183_9ACTN|nr:LuxR C-terminal-related transcriptional regulator [Catenuloplanes niger]MDR7327360.1 DNA-binding CsgD family transcriptional regulator [Catenuloplanes niger]
MTRMSVRERDALHGVERACALDLDSRSLRRELAARLSRVVGYDAYCFAAVDPWTLLLADEVSAGMPPDGGAAATHNEYLVDDVDKFAELARTRRTVGILGHSTGGEPDRSHRFRTLLPMIDARDEMRVVFLADGHCWGAISLFRGWRRPPFTPHEGTLVRAVARSIATALRRAAGRTGTPAPADTPSGPGVLLLDPRGRTVASNESARRWLEELSPLRMGLHEVAAASRAGAESYLRVRTRTGRWLSLSGSTMDGDAAGTVSIVVQPAPTSDIARMLALAYALSPREQEVLRSVVAGVPSAAIATGLRVSAHTVDGHLKSLFAKFGVGSRGQLVGRVVGDVHTRQRAVPDRTPGQRP